MELKRCPKCEINKPFTEFSKNRTRRDGFDAYCTRCNRARSRSHYKANRERLLERSRQWRLDHPEQYEARLASVRISDEAWVERKAASKLRQPQQMKEWQKNNPDKVAAALARSYEKHLLKMDADPVYKSEFLERRRQISAQRRNIIKQSKDAAALDRDITRIQNEGVKRKKSHHLICPVLRLYPGMYAAAKKELKLIIDGRRSPDQKRAATRRWKKENPAAVSSQRFRRRVHLSNALADLTEDQWHAIKAAYRFRCAYCGKRKPLTQDHIIPVSKGGDHTALNIVPACVSCNCSKGARPASVTYQPHLIA